MGSPTTVLRYTVFLTLCALALIVAAQLLTGRINARRLLHAKGRGAAGGLSPSRVQLLVVTAGVATYLLVAALRNPGALPQVPAALVLLLAASHITYLARKFNDLFLRRTS